MLSPRLQLKVSQKQILTPGLVQMVTVLQLNRLELKDMITQEIAENPVLEESADGIEELTPEEMQSILEAERVSDPSDQVILETVNGTGSEPEIAAGIPEASPPEIDFDAAPRRPSQPRPLQRLKARSSNRKQKRIRSTRSISDLFSTIIWTPDTRVQRPSKWRSRPLRRFFPLP